MKLLLSILLLVGLSSITIAADAPKEKAKAQTEAKAPTEKELQALAKSLTPAQKAKLLTLLNKGADADLGALPGVGPALKSGRPYAEPMDLLKVDGVGEATLAQILTQAKKKTPAKK